MKLIIMPINLVKIRNQFLQCIWVFHKPDVPEDQEVKTKSNTYIPNS